MSNAHLARLAGVSSPSVTGWFNGSTKVLKWTSAQAVAKAYGVSDTWVATGEGFKRPPAPARRLELPPSFDPERHSLEDLVPLHARKFRRVWSVGRGAGGKMPERIWTDGGYPVGATSEYAELATTDPHAFLGEVVGPSMIPRYNPGEFFLVEPGTDPDIEDDVLVRLSDGQTLLKRLLSKRGGIRLGSYNDEETLFYPPEDVSWIYYVAHPVPRRRIKSRTSSA